jgi:anthranilate phosphoribosyltransferase
MSLLPLLQRLVERQNLSVAEAREALETIFSGTATTAQIAGFLVALKMKGETAEELEGFARAMRNEVLPVDPGLGDEILLDTCGTGGDGTGTFNISTVVAFVVAGAGVRVAKHGNRSASSQCGSADVLETLGIRIDLTPGQMAQCIRDVGIGFLYAPALHPAMRQASAARLELKIRTVFNLLGPLTNPAGAQAQLIGAPSRQVAGILAQTILKLGTRRAIVVHGSDGLDEITTTGLTFAWSVENGQLKEQLLNPADFGLPAAKLSDLKGGDRTDNAVIIRSILAGALGPARNIVLANASAALVAAGKATDFRHGVSLAVTSVDSGAASMKLAMLAELTNRIAPK